jgi:isopenicillin-N epimerase
LPDLLTEARARLAAYVGTVTDNLVFVPNATHGVNIVARSLDLQPGDEVLTTNHEYGAAQQAWRFVCQKRQARFVIQAIPLPISDTATVVDQFWAGVTARTKVIFLSHITSPTALILPVAEICQRARAAGIIIVIDGAHAPGQVSLALDALGVDFYTGNCHKWLCAPKGSAFFYARPEDQPLLDPLVVGWGWQTDSSFTDYFQWIGTDDPAAYLSVPAAIDYQQAHNWPQLQAACHQLGRQIRRQIETLTGLPALYPDDERWWRQMFTMPLPPVDLDSLKERLWTDYQVEVPLVEWESHHFIRLSIQVYNGPEHAEKLMQGLGHLLG